MCSVICILNRGDLFVFFCCLIENHEIGIVQIHKHNKSLHKMSNLDDVIKRKLEDEELSDNGSFDDDFEDEPVTKSDILDATNNEPDQVEDVKSDAKEDEERVPVIPTRRPASKTAAIDRQKETGMVELEPTEEDPEISEPAIAPGPPVPSTRPKKRTTEESMPSIDSDQESTNRIDAPVFTEPKESEDIVGLESDRVETDEAPSIPKRPSSRPAIKPKEEGVAKEELKPVGDTDTEEQSIESPDEQQASKKESTHELEQNQEPTKGPIDDANEEEPVAGNTIEAQSEETVTEKEEPVIPKRPVKPSESSKLSPEPAITKSESPIPTVPKRPVRSTEREGSSSSTEESKPSTPTIPSSRPTKSTLPRSSTDDQVSTQKKAPPPVPAKPSSKIAAFQEMLRKQQEDSQQEQQELPPRPTRRPFALPKSVSSEENTESGDPQTQRSVDEEDSELHKTNFKKNLNHLFALPGMAVPGGVPSFLAKPKTSDESTGMREDDEKKEVEGCSDARKSRARGPRGKRLPKSATEAVKVEDKRSIKIVDVWKTGIFEEKILKVEEGIEAGEEEQKEEAEDKIDPDSKEMEEDLDIVDIYAEDSVNEESKMTKDEAADADELDEASLDDIIAESEKILDLLKDDATELQPVLRTKEEIKEPEQAQPKLDLLESTSQDNDQAINRVTDASESIKKEPTTLTE